MSEKYKYLSKKPMVIINKRLGLSKQAIRLSHKNHEPLLTALNDGIGEAVEMVLQKFGQMNYLVKARYKKRSK